MTPTRRDFLRGTLAAGAALAMDGTLAQARARKDDPQPKKILILGGTVFLGPALVEYAQSRGHTLTLFNRGKTRPNLFPDLEKLRGDRDPKKGDGLKALEGRKWDAVIDTSGYYPRMVKASAELLAPNVKHYTFISSVSVYEKNDKPGLDETDKVGTIPDPTVEEMGKDFANYGPLKYLCEQAAEKAMPGRTCNVRPGYIVGPGDPSDRFTYWPLRVAKGGEVLAPGTPSDPIQVIDVRDLAGWIIRMIEDNTTGVFNGIGPEKRLTMEGVLDASKASSKSDAKFTWVPADFLEKNGVGELPIWVPPQGETEGFHRRSLGRALKAGLTFRPIKTTIDDTLAWFKTLPKERQEALRAGLPAKREAEVLELWHKKNGTRAKPIE